MSTNSKTRVQSIDRALCILETLSNYESLSLVEISEKVNLHKATTHRLVNSLLDNGYIEKDLSTKHYRISLKLFALGNRRVQNIDFLNVAKSMIRQLAIEINQTVHLVIEDNQEVLYIDKYDPNENRMQSKIGMKVPMYCTAVGKAILATKTNTEIAEYWEKSSIRKLTNNTIVNLEDFLEEIENIRKKSYAIDNEENEHGVICIGATFSSFKNIAAGAISVSMPVSGIEKKPLFIEKILEATGKTSKILGYF
ncbi:IclR family transcriptional regulator [Clostridium sp. D2Q-14]|uniref:IclR family transcriptional regulator n=1 Tax=Anaeromonas gelatinilytica TaxID=2683194 RepID=UPI00193AE87A|nr:IclR family transcriptional regulator [Anaeromonas gelatinilytica]MBS4534776.1 IclR family transcriptional regulator [Anaeromonas gelatinilytica]